MKRAIALVQAVLLLSSGCQIGDAVDQVDTQEEDEHDEAPSSLPLGADAPSPNAGGLYDQLAQDGGDAVSVGRLPGAFKVTDDGVATYALALATPIGHSSVAPKLELRYASSGSDGLLGLGFTLGGMSTIHRCGRTMVPDGYRAPVKLDATDALCLDGARLVLTAGSHFTLGAQYRLENESFVRVRLVLGSEGDPTFVAEHPNGRRVSYGDTADSRQSTRGTTTSWSMSRVEDPFENFIEVEYASTTTTITADGDQPAESTIDHRPSRILMWGHGMQAPRPAVRFEYETRSDPTEIYAAGGVRHTTQRMSAVRMYDPEGLNFRTYHLHYEAGAGGRSRLRDVTLCGGTSGMSCMPPTTFEYADSAVEYVSDPTDDFGFAGFDWPNPHHGDHRISAVNVNGDLYDDLVFLSDETQTWHIWQGGPGGEAVDSLIASPENPDGQYWYPTRFRGMVGNDAFEDVVVVDAHLGAPPTALGILHGANYGGIASFGAAVAEHPFGPEAQLDAPVIWEHTWTPQMTAADFNADGLLDFAICHEEGDSSAWTIYESTAYPPAGWLRAPTETSDACADDGFVVVDVDGDRGANLLRIPTLMGESGNYLALVQQSDGSWTEVDSGLPRDHYQRALDASTPIEGRRGLGSDVVADLNGDGLGDIVRLEVPEGPGYEEVFDSPSLPHGTGHAVAYLSTGGGFRRGPTLWPRDEDDDEIQSGALRGAVALDVDADGGTDLLVDPYRTGHHHALSVRATTTTGTFAASSQLIAALDGAGQVLGPFDFNADGLGDLVAQQGWGGYPNEGYAEPVMRVGARPDLLAKITDGYGKTIEVDYAPLRAIHDRDEDCEDDRGGMVECVNDVRPVVHFETHDTGTTDPSGNVVRRTIEHAYRDGRRHRLGRGWLGFAEHSYSATDDAAPDVLTRVQMDNHTFDETIDAFPFAHRHGRVVRETEEVDGRRHVVDEETDLVVHEGPDDRTWFAAREFMRSRHFEITTQPGSCDPHQDCAIDLAELDTALPVRTNEIEHVYDDYGNVTKIRSVRTGGSTSVIDKVYTNDAANWRLGMMTSRVESSTVAGKTESRRTNFVYDPATGALSKSTVAPGHPTYELHTDIVRDDFGNVAIQTTTNASAVWGQQNLPTPAPRVVTTQFDALGVFPEDVTNALDQHTLFVHSYRHGQVRRAIDANGIVLDISYDGFGREVRAQRRLGIGGASSGVVKTTAYERAAGGGPLTPSTLRIVHETEGHEYLELELDKEERTVESTWLDLEGERVLARQQYSAAGLVVASELPHREGLPAPGSTHLSYDELGRLRVETLPDGAETITTYPAPFEESVEDPAGRVTRLVHDVEDHVVWSSDASGTTTCFTYGPFGSVTEIKRGCTNNSAHWTTAAYDSYGRRTQSNDPNQGKRTFSYDGFGNLVRLVDAGMIATSYEYDALGRVVKRSDGDGVTKWAWDRDAQGGYVGQLRSSTSPSGVQNSYAYDVFGRLRRESRTVGSTTMDVQHEYDLLGRHARTHMPSSFDVPLVLEYTHDDWGNLLTVKNLTNHQQLWAQTAQHAAGMIEGEQFGNGLITSRVYDPLTLRPQSIVTSDEEGEFEVQGLTYAFNSDGTLKSRGDAVQNQFETFTYDGLGRLRESFATKGFGQRKLTQTYDAFGNLTSRTDAGPYTYGDTNRPDRMTQLNGKAVSYDVNGNLRTIGSGLTIEYTAFDVPRRVTSGAVVTTHVYDAEGERAQRTSSADNSTTAYLGDYQVKRWGVQAQREHRYAVRALGRVVAEIVRSNAAEAGQPGPLGFVERTRYFHDDHLGSPDVLTNEGGLVEQRVSFEGFGRRRSPIWTSAAAPAAQVSPAAGFTGLDGETDGGLVAMRGRWYHPDAGRFLSPDPITAAPFEPLGQNRYAYAWNRPLSITDRTGFSPDQAEDCIPVPGTLRNIPVDTSDRGWGDDPGSGAHEYVMYASNGDLPYSAGRVVDAVQRENNVWDGVKAGLDVAGEELFAHAAQTLDVVNDFHSGVVDGTNPGITRMIREAIVPGATRYESRVYNNGHVQATVVTTLLGAAQVARGIAAIWAVHRAGRAAAAANASGQVGKTAGGSAAGASGASGVGETSVGFHSFTAFKRAMGPAGENMQWHHIVEQTTGNVAKFGARAVHNTGNLIRLETAAHVRVSALYSSIRPGLTGSETLTVRQWLSTQSFDAQAAFGRAVLTQVASGLL